MYAGFLSVVEIHNIKLNIQLNKFAMSGDSEHKRIFVISQQ